MIAIINRTSIFMEQIPKIRFSQFDNKWNSIPIGNLAKIKRGASPRPIQNPKWFDENSDIGWLRISDVTEQNGRIKYLEQKISKLGQEKTRVLTEPHLLLSIAATVGKPVVNYVKTGVHDGFLIFENPKFDREFMFQWFDMFKPKWNKYGQPGSQVNLNSDIIRNHKMMIPSLPEQSAIGSLFRILDDLLASYKENLANYQSLKATMLSKMFPKAGKTIPEIRLDGFEGEWEIQTLKELASFSKGNGYTKNDLVNSGKEIILYGRLYTNYQTVISKVNTFVTTVKANAVISKGGEVIVPASGESAEDISRASVVEKSGVILGGDLNIIYPDENKVDSIFLALTISNGSQQKELIKRAQGKSVVHLRNNDLEKVVLHYPSMEEQQAIGSYFSNLDQIITSYQEKITQLETLKKKLLQDMFV
mgnify:FL=1